jgi:mannose-6-phosphate isomerase-like protein (cupin superfamily)
MHKNNFIKFLEDNSEPDFHAENPFLEKNLIKKVEKNKEFRSIVNTLTHIQIVAMHIPVGEKIPVETHEKGDQLLYVTDGIAMATVDKKRFLAYSGDIIMIPQGKKHEIVNHGNANLKLLVFYSPPEHE